MVSCYALAESRPGRCRMRETCAGVHAPPATMRTQADVPFCDRRRRRRFAFPFVRVRHVYRRHDVAAPFYCLRKERALRSMLGAPR